MSYSDGAYAASTGRVFFYLSPMGAAALDLAASPNATLTLCEAQLPGGCANLDPQDPNCAKVALSGEVLPLQSEAAVQEAKGMLFARHPAMADWPAGHAFAA